MVTSAGQLVRLGFADATAAERRLADLGPLADVVLDAVTKAADPDQALGLFGSMVAAATNRAELERALADDERLRVRLFAVLGASTGLGQHLIRHPEHWRELADPSLGLSQPDAAGRRATMLEAVGADPHAAEPRASSGGVDALDALRIAYRRLVLRLAARDLTAHPTVDEVAAELADLAAGALEAALAVARARLPENAAPCRLAVIGLGKCGGRELNYVSDVDVLFVAEPANEDEPDAPALKSATQLATQLMRVCSEHTAEGTLWPVDAGLRPEGKSGPLVRTLDSHVAYAHRWAKTWEFQALLKARPVAGDHALGQAYVDALTPMVWAAADRDHFVDDVQAMRRRVVDHIPAAEVDRQLKLGPGGLRDVEFSVQLLQLVHGRSDESIRSANTLVALAALTAGGYVGRDDGAALAAAYRFLRTLEHRLQLSRLRRTHLLPEDEAQLRCLGRSLGMMTKPVTELLDTWRRHAREVRRLHEKLFYRPLLAAVARISGPEARLTPEAARERLTALGYLDPSAALRHLEALTAGVSRRAAIQRTLLPVMLGWFADGQDPDAGLLAFRQISDDLGSTPWYLRLLRDEGVVAERYARILASSRYVVDLLRRAPEAVEMLGRDEDLRPRALEALESEVLAAASRYDDPAQAIVAVRAVRRRELFRTAAADLLGMLSVAEVGSALTAIASATVSGGLRAASRAVEAARSEPLPTRLAAVAMGSFGGQEMGYGSDVDVMFVYDPVPGADEKDASDAAFAVVSELLRLFSLPATDPPFVLDLGLRPEGRQGPIVRSLASYAAYYGRWSHVWEAQALLRADPRCGDASLRAAFAALVDPLRWPSSGVSEADLREIRRIKARVDAERLPRGADPASHTKLGPGGMADVQWTVQLLQLQHAARVPGLRTPCTAEALQAAVDNGLVDSHDASALLSAWRLVNRARNAVVLVRAKASDLLPRDARDLAAVARVLGYEPLAVGEFLEDYFRETRHARGVVDRLFWG